MTQKYILRKEVDISMTLKKINLEVNDLLSYLREHKFSINANNIEDIVKDVILDIDTLARYEAITKTQFLYLIKRMFVTLRELKLENTSIYYELSVTYAINK